MAHRIYNQKAWRDVRELVLARDRHRCTVVGCGKPADAVDHIVPWRDGGAWYDPENLRAICVFHNSSRVVRGAKVLAGATRRPSREW